MDFRLADQSRGIRLSILCVLGGLLVTLATAPSAKATEGPYEPNATLATAYGPLTINQTYTAVMETENDKAYFYFYVTSPSTSQVMITMKNLGGGTNGADGETAATLEEEHGEGVSDDVYARAGDYSTKAVTLSPGKYYIEVTPQDGYGESYSLTTGGTTGAFGEYAPIAAQCAAANADVAAVQAALNDATTKLKRDEGKVIGSRHKSRRTKRGATRAKNKASQEVKTETDDLKAAEETQKPWCFIPQ